MLQIGKLYIQRTGEQARLCADLNIDGRGATLWFGVDPSRQTTCARSAATPS